MSGVNGAGRGNPWNAYGFPYQTPVGGYGERPQALPQQYPTQALAGGYGGQPQALPQQYPTQALAGGYGGQPQALPQQYPTQAPAGGYGAQQAGKAMALGENYLQKRAQRDAIKDEERSFETTDPKHTFMGSTSEERARSVFMRNPHDESVKNWLLERQKDLSKFDENSRLYVSPGDLQLQAPARPSTPPGFKPKYQRSIAAAAKYGVSPRQWEMLSRNERKLISSHPNQKSALEILSKANLL